MNERYLLHIGCHRNTVTSRDSEVREFDTKEGTIKSYRESKSFYHSIGYIERFMAEARSGDYDDLLRIVMKYFEVK